MPVELVFHESQYPDAVRRSLLEALSRGRVPGRFLYDSPGQAARWLAYHRAWSPSRTEDTTAALYDAAFEATWANLEGNPPTYVGVGCGGGAKDARCVARAPNSVRYVAADTSPALVLEAGARVQAAAPRAEVRRVVLDLAAQPDRLAFLGDPAGPVVWSCFGLIPNLDADWLLPYVRSLMAPQDSLLLSVNASPAPYPEARARIVPQYDNPPARAWYQGALDELGLSARDARLVMSDRALSEDGSAWRIEAHAMLERDLEVAVFADTVALPAGARLEVFHSDRYLPEALPELFTRHGLTATHRWVGEAREEGVYRLVARG